MLELRRNVLGIAMVVMAGLTAGCSTAPNPFFPSLASPSSLKPATGATVQCRTDNLLEAKQCADASIVELKSKKQAAINFKRGFGYTVAAGGAAAGAALVFEAPIRILRILGVATASALGLEATMGLDAQIAAFKFGIKATECVITAARAAEVLHGQAEELIRRNQNLNFTSGKFFTATAASFGSSPLENVQKAAFLSLQGSVGRVLNKANSQFTDKSIAVMLSDAVLAIRTTTDNELEKSIPDLSKIEAEQRKRIKALVKELIEAHDAAKKDIAKAEAVGGSPDQVGQAEALVAPAKTLKDKIGECAEL